MELESITSNTEQKNANRNTSGPPTRSQNQTEKKSRWFVVIAVCLGCCICVLVVGILALYKHLTSERDLMKMSYMNTAEEYKEALNSLTMNYSQLTNETEELQNRFNSMRKMTLEIKTKVMNLTSALIKNIPRTGSCSYFMSSKKQSWSYSSQFCRDRGGDLIIINTEEEQRYTSLIVEDSVWIGLSDIETEGIMKWQDNTTLNKGFWYQDEPNDEHGNEDCVKLMGDSNPILNNWNDCPCSEMNKFICEF